jgi:photosystem II stability/assembly factor-like uncharacterized protein
MRRLLSISMLLLILPVSSFAGWSWLYPQPQGHNLSDIVFLDNTTAIAVGEATTILVTHDTGDTWSVQSMIHGIGSTLLHVERINASTAVAVGKEGVILRSNDSGATWDLVASGTSTDLLDVSFADAQHGVAVSSTRALRTSDGGLTWQSSVFSHHVASVDMINPGYAVALEGPDSLLRSHDGGETWSAQKVPDWGFIDYPGYMGVVEFADSLVGFISGSASSVTVDGGVTWDPTNVWTPDFDYEFQSFELVCGNADQVAAAFSSRPAEGYSSGHLSLTVNHGQAWTPAGASGWVIKGSAINNDGVVLTVGDAAVVCRRATDGTFLQIGGSTSTQLFAARYTATAASFLDPEHGVVLKSTDHPEYMFSYLARTTDGGTTWANSSLPGVVNAVAYTSATELYAVSTYFGSATVFHSATGGASWESLWSGGVGGLTNIAFGNLTHGIAVGQTGKVVVIDGTAATEVSTGIDVAHRDIGFTSAQNAVAVGQGGAMAHTGDGGQTWDPIASPTTNDLFAIDFVAGDEGCAVGSNVVLRTHNGGQSWDPIQNPPVGTLLDVDFGDELHGIAVGRAGSSNGVAFSTEDGGDVWVPLVPPTPNPLSNVTMFSQTHAYVGGHEQFLFEYKSTTVPTLFSSFTVTPKSLAAELRWMVHDEGNLAAFRLVRRSTDAEDRMTTVDLNASNRAYTDNAVQPGASYEYQLVAVERSGEEIPSIPVRVTIPAPALELFPNQPNPFNPATTIRFVVPEKSRVMITVHDVAGRVVATLLDAVREAGQHSIRWDGGNAPSGVYFVRLSAGKAVESRKMVLLK